MSVEHFFDRDDPDKFFIRQQLMQAENPEKTMANYLECIAKVNSKEHYDKYAKSDFFHWLEQIQKLIQKLKYWKYWRNISGFLIV